MCWMPEGERQGDADLTANESEEGEALKDVVF